MNEWTFTPTIKKTGEHLEDVTVEASDFVEGWEKSDRVLEARGIQLYEGEKRLIGYITKSCKPAK